MALRLASFLVQTIFGVSKTKHNFTANHIELERVERLQRAFHRNVDPVSPPILVLDFRGDEGFLPIFGKQKVALTGGSRHRHDLRR